MKTLEFLIIMMLAFAAYSLKYTESQQKQPEPWEVAAKYKDMKNPISDDVACVSKGKSGYSRHCRSCHGNTGLGDGPKAARLKTFPGDFSGDKFHNQTDGEIYYKSIWGRGEMPNYEKKIPNEKDRWALVVYLRTLKK